MLALSAGVVVLGGWRLAGAAVFGADDRDRPDALLNTEDERLFSATQFVACKAPDGKSHGGGGSLAGDFTHGVTVAHLFYNRELGREHLQGECMLRVHDRNGNVIDAVPIVRFKTFWGAYPLRSAQDLAMFELARRPKFVDRVINLEPTQIHAGEELLLVAFHFDIKPRFSKRKTRGRVYSTLGTRDEGMPNVFHTDVDEVPNSSGCPLYNRAGAVVGLVLGSSVPRGAKGAQVFDHLTLYNRAIRPNAQFVREFEEFLRSR